MAISSPPRCVAQADGTVDITNQAAGESAGLWPGTTASSFRQEQIDAIKPAYSAAVINQSHQQYLQSLRISISPVGEGYAADHLARLMEQEGFPLVSVGGALNNISMTVKASRGGSVKIMVKSSSGRSEYQQS